MTTASERITELLHRTRSTDWTSDDALALSGAIRSASPDEAKLALLDFGYALLAAARTVVTLQRDAALLAEMMAERDERGPLQ